MLFVPVKRACLVLLLLTFATTAAVGAPASAQTPTTPATGTAPPKAASTSAQSPVPAKAAPETKPASDTAPQPPADDTPAKADAVGTTVGMPVLSNTGLHELSPWSMFLAADVVVKTVMIGLMIASLVTWTILIGKTIELALARRRLAKTIDLVERARTIQAARVSLRADDLLAELLGAATRELDLSGPYAPLDGIKVRSDSRLADIVRVETQSMRRGMGILATIGSTAPFVGLFGTVWGIMNSFIGISKSQTTNLAVVAPGIAEALLATAIGLVAAIPAVIIYNHFSRATRSYQLMITRAAGVVTRLTSRELDLEPRAMARAAE